MGSGGGVLEAVGPADGPGAAAVAPLPVVVSRLCDEEAISSSLEVAASSLRTILVSASPWTWTCPRRPKSGGG